jgi:Mg-chelatase subunit ChlD
MTQESLDKKKGIPDIVFLLDASGSMKECIQAVTQNISTFVDTLATPDSNGGIQIKDWRIRVVGYRDRDADGEQWLVDNPFTSDVAAVKSQLAALEAKGGGDEPESLLDAMYTVTQWASSDKGGQALPNGWRHRHDAARVLVIFTDASCKPGFKAADGSTGTVTDLIQACNASKLKVILYAPMAPSYTELGGMSGLEWEPVGELGDKPVEALKAYTSDAANFRKVMEALAKSVSQSAATPTL